MAWFWTNADERAFETRCSRDRETGFLHISQPDLSAPDVAEYERILRDPAHWTVLNQRMDNYFNDQLVLFPYRDSEASQSSGPLTPAAGSREWLRRMASVYLPDRFYEIQGGMIERRFPRGGDGMSDSDIRDLVACLRFVAAKNFWSLVLKRRAGSLLASLCVLASLSLVAWVVRSAVTTWPLGTFPALSVLQIGTLAVAAVLVICTLIWVFEYPKLSHDHETANERSSGSVRTALEVRFRHLKDSIPRIFDKIGTVRFYLDDPNDWPEEAKKWSKLALWMSMRVQYLEFYLLLEMWRIRRTQAWMRLLGYLMARATLLISTVALIGIGLGSASGAVPLAQAIIVAACAVAGMALLFLNYLSYKPHLTDHNLIEKNLKTSQMPGFRDSKLHDQMAEKMFQTLMEVLQEENPYRQHATRNNDRPPGS